MAQKEYLSYEEQFKENINHEEICRIKDPMLREIRLKYLNKQLEMFLDEINIPDSELEKLSNNVRKEELKELEAYKNKSSHK